MEVFLQIVFAFPTVVFSVLLAAAVGYWLLAALGLLELDVMDGWLGAEADGISEPAAITGPLMRLGLGGIPLTLVVTVLIFFAWLISYFTDYLLLRHLPFELLRLGLGTVVMIGAFLAAVPATSVALRPVRGLFQKLRPAAQKSILGQSAVIRSPIVTPSRGTASVEDGGAGLILQVRDSENGRYQRGDRVVLIEYVADQNAYRVVGEDEFLGL